MPTDIDEASTGHPDLLFPDELQGCRFTLLDTGLYDAEEVQSQLDSNGDVDTPQFGRWLHAEVDGFDGPMWVSCPGELLEELQRAETKVGQTWKVTRCKKSGTADTAPYEVNAVPQNR